MRHTEPPTKVRLSEPCSDLRDEFLTMAEEFYAVGESRYNAALSDFAGYYEQLSDLAKGIDLKPGRVPANEFWLIDDDRVIGRSSLRHHLTTAFELEGGHIGYDIRPAERRKGYGTLILELTLEKAKDRGLTKVLVTCDSDNTGSTKIIKRNGGRFIGQAISPNTGKDIFRFEIEVLSKNKDA